MSAGLWTAFLVNFMFWTGTAAGGAAFAALLDLTGAQWAAPLRATASRFCYTHNKNEGAWHMSAAEPDPNHASQAIVARVRALANGHPHVAICCDSGRSSFVMLPRWAPWLQPPRGSAHAPSHRLRGPWSS